MDFEITSLYAALLALLTAALGFATVIIRAKTGHSFGDGSEPRLHRAIRAHGNLIEYAPIFLIVLLLLENAGASSLALHGLGSAFVLGRLLLAAYFWITQIFALRVIALWAAVLPLVIGAAMLLS